MGLECRIGEQWFRLLLRPGRFRGDRHLKMLRRALTEGWKLGEVTLRMIRTSGTNRNGGTERGRGGNHFETTYKATVSAYMPRTPGVREDRTLFVKTDKEALLVCLDADANKLFTLHEPQVRRWIAEWNRKRHQLAEDQKLERRVPRVDAGALASYRTRLADKHHKRLNDYVHKVARIVVNHAGRRKAARIDIDLTDQGYVQNFPWKKLRTLIEDKAKEVGITIEEPKPEEESPIPAVLENP
jgi:transposase